ncbi:hypothetical protein TNCV_3808401 [Trichonephila clavipes]|nr:hypothetical protein TNCV_3808401 [Trichonephila clavipes]
MPRSMLLEQLRETSGLWKNSMQRAENIRELINLKPAYVLTIARCRFLRHCRGQDISWRTQSHGSTGVKNVSFSKRALCRSEDDHPKMSWWSIDRSRST